MAEPTARPALADVIACALGLARKAGITLPDIGPDDFALQRSPAGWQQATYLGDTYVLTAVIRADGVSRWGVGEVTWIDPADIEDEPEMFRGVPLVDVQLPDEVTADV